MAKSVRMVNSVHVTNSGFSLVSRLRADDIGNECNECQKVIVLQPNVTGSDSSIPSCNMAEASKWYRLSVKLFLLMSTCN